MLDLDTQLFFTQTYSKHIYTFACTGLKVGEREFSTRQLAKEYMYKQCKKNGLFIQEVWTDGHDVTYVCNNNVKFYIHRV